MDYSKRYVVYIKSNRRERWSYSAHFYGEYSNKNEALEMARERVKVCPSEYIVRDVLEDEIIKEGNSFTY